MKCKKCGAEVDEGVEFCSECGARMAKKIIVCPYCNAEIADGKFCSNCGRRLDESDAGKEHSEEGASCGIKGDILTDIDDFGISKSDSPEIPGNSSDFSAKMEMLSKKRMAEKNEYEKKEALSKALSDFKYIIQSNGNIVITGLVNDYIIEAVIPEGVVSIADDAFKDSELVMVELPKSIIKIGDRAFMGCKDLSSINFPEKLMLVGDEAFSGCSSLDIEFPKTIKNIGKDSLKDTAAYNRKIKEQEERKRKAEEERKRKEEEERKRKAEEERRRRAEEERKRKEEENRKRKEEEERRCREEEQRRRIEEAERRAKEEERMRKKEEEERRYREEKKTWLDNCRAGSIIKFGDYHGATEWRVVKKYGDKMWIIAKDIIDAKPYHASGGSVTWENCTLRAWLNNEYLNEAFSEEEKNRIWSVNTNVNGNVVSNKVFLFGTGDMQSEEFPYLNFTAKRMAKGTDYAKNEGLWIDSNGSYSGYSCWWLANLTDNDSNCAVVVGSGGGINTSGCGVNFRTVGVRPGLLICTK